MIKLILVLRNSEISLKSSMYDYDELNTYIHHFCQSLANNFDDCIEAGRLNKRVMFIQIVTHEDVLSVY